MRNWKKTDQLLIILILVLLGLEAVMEARYRSYEFSVTSTDTKAIVRQVPETVITEGEKALLRELEELSSVQELLADGENESVWASEDPEVAAAAERYLGEEEAGTLFVSVVFFEDGSATYMGWQEGTSSSYVQVTPEESGAAYYKIYLPKRGVHYENWDNERIQKGKVHRRWFAWLRDGMWKEG